MKSKKEAEKGKKSQSIRNSLLQDIFKLNTKAYLKITQDPLAQVFLSDLETKVAMEEATKSSPNYSSFSLYASSLRKIPDESLFIQYLTEMKEALVKEDAASKSAPSKAFPKPFSSEKSQINARRIWGNLLTAMDKRNTRAIDQEHIRDHMVQRLIGLGYANNPELIYEKCIDYVKNNSAIVITFNASFLSTSGLTDLQTLNFFEKGSNTYASSLFYKPIYGATRKLAESGLFKEWTSELASELKPEQVKELKGLFENIHAKPRYAELQLLNGTYSISCHPSYGKSFIVLRNVNKLDALFNPRDSLNAKLHTRKDLRPCTYHSFEVLLSQSTDNRLNAIASQVTKGSLPKDYISNIDNEEYIEVMLPAIQVLDPNIVEHIYLDPSEYVPDQEASELLARLAVPVTHSTENPYKALHQPFLKAVRENNIEEIKKILKTQPSLMRITDSAGLQPIHIAAKNGNSELVNFFIAQGSDMNMLSPENKTPLHYALESGNVILMIEILQMHDLNLLRQEGNSEKLECLQGLKAYMTKTSNPEEIRLDYFDTAIKAMYYLIVDPTDYEQLRHLCSSIKTDKGKGPSMFHKEHPLASQMEKIEHYLDSAQDKEQKASETETPKLK